MATSGQLNTNTTYDSYFWVKWEQVGDQDIENNRTQIRWTCGLYTTHKFYAYAIRMSAVTINGVKVFNGGTYSNFTDEGNQTIATGTMWIDHSADGTKTFSISSFTGWLYSNNNYSSSGGSYALTTIPRGATITSAPNFTDMDSPTISYSNQAGEAATSLMACITFTGALADVPYRDIPKGGDSYTFNFTDEELEKLRTNTSGSSRSLMFCIQTNFGDTVFRHTYPVTFSIEENDDSKPAIMMTASLDNGSLPSKFGSLCIQGKSRYDVTLSADGKYGATITSLYATLEGKTHTQSSFKTDVIQGSGNVELVGYAKDSRGFTRSATPNINAIAYSKPLVIPLGSENAVQCYRSDGNGIRVGNSTSVWIKAKKSHHDVAGRNKCALQWRWKKVSEAWSDTKHPWVELVSKDATTNEYNALVGVVFDLKEAYTIQVMAIDDIGENDIKTFEIPTRDVALHLGKGGKNVAIGTYCDYSEDRTFYSEWKAIFGGGVYIGNKSLKEYIQDVINGGG